MGGSKMSESLFNEYEAYTVTGSELSDRFLDLIHEFIKKAVENHSSIEVEQILISTLSTELAILRIKKAVMRRKQIREQANSITEDGR
jgi:hypothetical protein